MLVVCQGAFERKYFQAFICFGIATRAIVHAVTSKQNAKPLANLDLDIRSRGATEPPMIRRGDNSIKAEQTYRLSNTHADSQQRYSGAHDVTKTQPLRADVVGRQGRSKSTHISVDGHGMTHVEPEVFTMPSLPLAAFLEADMIEIQQTATTLAPVVAAPIVVAAAIPASPAAAVATTVVPVAGGSTTAAPASAAQTSDGHSWLFVIFLVLLVPWAGILSVFLYTRGYGWRPRSSISGQDDVPSGKPARMSYRARKSQLAEKADAVQVVTDCSTGTDVGEGRRTPRGTTGRESRRKKEVANNPAV